MAEPDLYAVADRFKLALRKREDAAVREVLRYYREATTRIRERLDALIEEMARYRQEHPDEEMPPWWLFEQNRLERLQEQIEAELERFARQASHRLQAEQRRLIEQAVSDAEALARASGVRGSWTRLSREAIEQLVGTLQQGSPLRDLLDALGPAASETIRKELVSGLSLGVNPREVARRCRAALGGNRARAELIARTEMLRAYREASRASYLANRDVLSGWVWHSARDERTCVMCWAMHGTVHALEERLDDHPRGRCAMLPLTKSWADLGAQGVPETRARVASGETLFAQLSPEQQRAILGNAAYEAYKAGVVKLSDFVGQKSDPRWGTTRYARSLTDILGADEAKRWRTSPSHPDVGKDED